MIASLLHFDVLHLLPKRLALREKPFLARHTSHNLASFEVRAVKASCYCRGPRASFPVPRWEAWVRGEGRWLCLAIMKGQSHRGFKRLVSAQKMKSSPLWRASLVLRFKYISQILCVRFRFNFPLHDTTSPLHYFSSLGVL